MTTRFTRLLLTAALFFTLQVTQAAEVVSESLVFLKEDGNS
jgi:hypothetical protein